MKKQLSREIIIDLPEDADLEVELAKTTEGGRESSVLSASAATVEEAMEELGGKGHALEFKGNRGTGNPSLHLPKAEDPERLVAIAFDDEGEPYLASRGQMAAEGGARLDLRLAQPEDEKEEAALLFSPLRTTRLWVKEVLRLPQRELGLLEIEKGALGDLEYTKRERLAAGGKTALVIHGALSELRAMEELSRYLMSARCPRNYDRIVGFDYETVATGIRDNGRALATALRDLPRDGSLDIFAYSMGTQVARSFLEHEQGTELASKVVLVAPPNRGTRLAEDQDRLLKLGSMVLSKLAGTVGLVLGLLLRVVEWKDQGLDDLKPGSRFQQELEAREGRGERQHHTISGVTEEAPKFLLRLLGQAAEAYFREENDWVVPFSSTSAGPVEEPRVAECNHFGFFRDECRPIRPWLYEWLR